MDKQGNRNNQNLIIIIFLVVILYLIYSKQKEGFNNYNKSKFVNYQGLTTNSGPIYVKTTKTIDELDAILFQIIHQINQKTNSNFHLVEIDNVTNNTVNNTNDKNYVVDVFVHEKYKDYTLRLIIDFTIQENKKIQINTITRSNSFKYDFNAMNNNTLEDEKSKTRESIDKCITDETNFTQKVNIKASNNIDLPYSLYESDGVKNPMPVEFANDFLPTIVEQDVNYRKLKEINEKNKKVCNNKMRCWDCQSVANRNPQFCSCSSINKFKLERTPLLNTPKFNPSIHKNISDEKENNWLFTPTRVEIDHNF